jgi:hypothetical protein
MPKARASRGQVRAVAFTIEDKVYAGAVGESHLTLYLRLLQDKRVPAATLDAWTNDDKNHGFVTHAGEFLDRAEAFRRFGTKRSQDLKAQGVLQQIR